MKKSNASSQVPSHEAFRVDCDLSYSDTRPKDLKTPSNKSKSFSAMTGENFTVSEFKTSMNSNALTRDATLIPEIQPFKCKIKSRNKQLIPPINLDCVRIRKSKYRNDFKKQDFLQSTKDMSKVNNRKEFMNSQVQNIP